MRDERILVIDDEPTVTILLERRLKQEGFACKLAHSADQALEYLREEPYVAALVDIRMPGKDGIALLGEMKSLDPDLAAIMVTAIKDRESAVRAMRLGAEDYIVKPFDLDEVVTSLHRALDKRRLMLENRAYHQELERLVAERTRDLRRRNRELAALNALAAVVGQSLDQDEVLHLGLDQLLRIIQVEVGGVYVQSGRALRLQARQGTDTLPQTLEAGKALQSVLVVGPQEASDQPIYLPDAVSEARVPLQKGTEPLGMLLVASKTRPLTQDDLRLLAMIGDQMSVALDNAHLYGEVQRQASALRTANVEFARANRRLRTLREIGASVVSTFSLDEVLQRIADGVVAGLEYKMALIGVVEAQRGQGKMDQILGHLVVSGTNQGLIQRAEELTGTSLSGVRLRLTDGDNLASRVVEEGRIHVTHALYEVLRPALEEAECQALQREIGARCLVVVPLQARGRMVGAVVIATDCDEVDQEELLQLKTFADQAAIAIENARLYQEALAAQQRSATILAEAFTGIMVVDTYLRIQEFNPAAETITGYQADEVLGHPLWQFFGEEVYCEGSPLRRAITTDSQILPTETTIAGRRGKRDILLAVTPLVGEESSLAEYLLSFADVTELKEIERLKTNIVANVSHELRTPLASIRAYTELLIENLDEGDEELRQRFLGVIDQETQDLADLITDLLNVARLESGRFVPHKEDTSLRYVAEEALDRLRTQAGQRGIQLLLDVPPDLPSLPADPEMMGILLKNLIGNAVKFSTRGGEVSVSLQADGERQMLTVTDHGVGIAPEDLPHIFEKFYRGHSTVESGFEGTGLGLALVKEVVEAHGGSIEVQSEQGTGTQFTIILPMTPSFAAEQGA
jgi:PAS domain S-box-containing protein